MSEWKTLRKNELGNKCFHNPEWAHDEILRLKAELGLSRQIAKFNEDQVSAKCKHIERLTESNTILEHRLADSHRNVDSLKAELKQANAVVDAAKKFRDNNDFYNIGPWTDVEIALAKLETDDE